MMNDADRTIEILINCIELLLELLKETVAADRAEAIYQDFFGK